jgi:uncharacterized membrane protein YeaQ/YmgE (transglycosylase-associated protein family)
MSIFGSIILGLLVGFLARGIMPGEQKMGWILTCLLGMAGSLLATFAGQMLGWYGPGEFAGWIASVLAALALLFTVGKLRGNSRD